MSLRGYSYRLVKANKTADPKHIGVKLGKFCIANDITVIEIADMFKVSRMTIYNWFIGETVPHKAAVAQIEKLIK